MTVMFNPFDEMKSEITTAASELRRNEERLASSSDEITAGQLFLFDTGADEGIEWATVKQHVDDAQLWFAVPFDQHYQVGTWDVFVAEYSDAGEGALRCGAGIWIHSDDFARGARTGFLEDGYVDKACARLAVMVQSNSVDSGHRPGVDEDPEYQEWMDVVLATGERLSESMADSATPEQETIPMPGSSTAWATAPGIHQPPVSLAASENGLGAGPATVPEPLPGSVIADNLPGTLVAVKESTGLRLQYHVADDQDLHAEVNGAAVDWTASLQRVRQSRDVYPVSESLVIRVNGRQFEISPGSSD